MGKRFIESVRDQLVELGRQRLGRVLREEGRRPEYGTLLVGVCEQGSGTWGEGGELKEEGGFNI